MAGIAYGSSSVQFLDPVTKTPLVSGKVFTFITETTIDKATYSDSALTSANANPIVLDADGRATIFLARDSLYTFKIMRSDDTKVRTEDSIGGIDSGESGCALTNTLDNVLTTGIWVPLVFDTELRDTLGFHNNTNPTRITIPAGVTRAKFTGIVDFSVSSLGARSIQLYQNGLVTFDQFKASLRPSGVLLSALVLETPWTTVEEGQYYELFATHTLGFDLTANAASTYFEVETTG